jgi:hypothetical protein
MNLKLTLVLIAASLTSTVSFAATQDTQAAPTVAINVAQYPVEHGCDAAAQAAADLIKLYPHEEGWKYVVVCDELSWQKLMILSATEDASYVYGSTFPTKHVTFLRASTLVATKYGQPTPNHIVAHELAHVFLHSRDEIGVDKLAEKWLKWSTAYTLQADYGKN